MLQIFDIFTSIAAVASTIAAIFGFVMWRIVRNQELSRLKALHQHLEFTEGSAKSHDDYLKNEKKPFPSWNLINIDLNHYLSHINYKMRRENGICYEPTKNLKSRLIAIYERAETINFLRKLEIEGKKTDLRLSTYYQDLIKDIDSCKTEIERIVNVK